MDLLFNKDNAGKEELKATLGFLDADFTYKNIEPDIKLNTPFLIDLTGQEVYDKMTTYYKATNPTQDANLDAAIEYARLYIASMAYLDYAPNNDLSHKNSGRSFRSEDSEKIPWDWQIAKDNKAIAERGYKALDRLFALLEETQWTEWTESDAYTTANKLFIKNSLEFDKAFSINKSAQLYYRLVPFMEDIETDDIIPIISETLAQQLKTADTPTADQKKLISLSRKALAYISLSKGLQSFPIVMFPKALHYPTSKTTDNTKLEERDKLIHFMNAEGEKYLKKLENEYGSQNETFTTLKTTNGLEEGKKYVNL